MPSHCYTVANSAHLVRSEGLLLRIPFQLLVERDGFLMVAIKEAVVGATRMFTHRVGTRDEKFGDSFIDRY